MDLRGLYDLYNNEDFVGLGLAEEGAVVDQGIDMDMPEVATMMRERILDGKRADGSIISSGYSRSWALRRIKAGRQIGYMDYQYTAELLNALMVKTIDSRTKIVFATASAEKKAERLEESRAGVFAFSEAEIDKVNELIAEKL